MLHSKQINVLGGFFFFFVGGGGTYPIFLPLGAISGS